MATFRKRNGRWQVQVRRAGQKAISKSFHNKTDAQRWAREKELEADRQGMLVDTGILKRLILSELVDRYVREITPRKKSAQAETYVLRAFQKHPICKRALVEITTSRLAQYRDERLEVLSPSGMKRELVSIGHMFQTAIDEWGIPLRENPLSKLKLNGTDNRRERRLRDGEYEKLLEAARTRQNPLVEQVVIFAIETAMRRGEILSLSWDQVDLKRRSVTILESKNGYSRTIPLTNRAFALLQSCSKEEVRVFPITPNALRLSWDRMLKDTDISDLHFHDLRHEAISRFFEMGLTVPEVASISGHRDLRMLMRYAHASIGGLVEKVTKCG